MKPSARQMSALVTVAVRSFFLSACGSGAPDAVDVPTATTSSETPVKGSVASEDSPEAEQTGEEVEALEVASDAAEGEAEVLASTEVMEEVMEAAPQDELLGPEAASSRVYSLGQIGPGGGFIFLTPESTRNATGKYFEVAPISWSGVGTPDAKAKYCVGDTDVPGTDGSLIGTGAANTAAMAKSVECNSPAAKAVQAYSGGGYTDWFLPSSAEFIWMMAHVRNTDRFGLGRGDYWTSNQNQAVAPGTALSMTPYSGYLAKTSSEFRVRPVRSF